MPTLPFVLLSCLLYSIRLCVSEVVTMIEDGKVKEYMVADLLTRSRPKSEMLRMYPHMLPFGDLVEPTMRSFLYGYPQTGNATSDFVTAVDVFKKQWPNSNRQSTNFFSRWFLQSVFSKEEKSDLQRNLHIDMRLLSGERSEITCKSNTNAKKSTPVRFELTNLLKPRFNFKTDFLDRIDDGEGSDGYNYLSIDREFIVGIWYSMEKEGYFADGFDKGWSRMSECKGRDPICLWHRIFVIALSLIKLKSVQNEDFKIPSLGTMHHSLDSLAVSFWLAYCTRVVGRDDAEFRHFCPNPCKANPCAGIANTIADSCTVINKGLFSTDYICQCVPGARWSKNHLECQSYNLCKDSSTCSRHGMMTCEYNPLKRESHCSCKPGYMGDRCELERNACFERYNSSTLTGNWACNVEEGNQCHPVLGTDIFTCTCRGNWRSDPSWRSSSADGQTVTLNCLRFNDACMGTVCEVGDCIGAINGAEAVCQCPPSHYGKRCERTRGFWSPWGPWSSCDPDCGHLRVRMRNRGCLGSECFGHEYETEWCNANECVPVEVINFPLDRWRSASALRLFLVATTTIVAVALCSLLVAQLVLIAWLSNDRTILDARIFERRSIEEILGYQRLSSKHALMVDGGFRARSRKAKG